MAHKAIEIASDLSMKRMAPQRLKGRVSAKSSVRQLIIPRALRTSEGLTFAVIGMAPKTLPLITSIEPSRSMAVIVIISLPSGP